MDKPSVLDYAIAPLTWLERARGWKRLGLLLSYLVFTLVVGVAIWRESLVWRLPDIGEPFDVDRLGTVAVSDADNAYPLYQQAARELIAPGVSNYKPTLPKAWDSGDWATADPEVRRWVVDNRLAFGHWLAATERPDFLLIQPRDFGSNTSFQVPVSFHDFARLANLEASRLEADGDLAGAWRFYRASLRSSRHVGRHGSTMLRNFGLGIFNQVRPSIEAWAGDPRVTPAMLRAAIADVETCRKMTSLASERIRADYFVVRSILDDPVALRRYEQRRDDAVWDWRQQLSFLPEIELFLAREPDRARRILNLIVAGQLAQCDRPRSARPNLASQLYPIYEVDAETPSPLKAIGPKDLEKWAKGTKFALVWGGTNGWQARLEGEPGLFDTLLLTLAERGYTLEHGRAPKTFGDLLGSYLKALPEDIAPGDLISAESDPN